MKVLKFGGTSMATAEQIKKVYDIIISDPERRMVVVSAPGKRFENDIKITDLLIKYANKISLNQIAEEEKGLILRRYIEIAEGLKLDREIIESIVDGINNQLTYSYNDLNYFFEAVKSIGENTSAKIVAHYFQKMGHEAYYINPKEAGLILSDELGKARVLDKSYTNLNALKERSGILIFPGFFGYTDEGNIITFPRGGSDITGSILAAALNADIYENFTDVDSIYVVNPKIINNPKEICQLTFTEMRELSYSGFTVFNEEALMPAYRAGITVNVKNTNNSSAKGTMIVQERETYTNPITGIASDNGFCSIYVSKYLMNREVGFGRKLLKILEDENLSYEHTPSGIDNISVILREHQLNSTSEERILTRIKNELQVDDIMIQHNLAMVMIVGEGMKQTVGIAARATMALAEARINIEMINQGSSEVSMMFGISAEDEKRAVTALYNEFFA